MGFDCFRDSDRLPKQVGGVTTHKTSTEGSIIAAICPDARLLYDDPPLIPSFRPGQRKDLVVKY
jgi:hypothetical protein